jgi:D-alanyl-D-alanine endopeptidase (penicillin-binding protein 7)
LKKIIFYLVKGKTFARMRHRIAPREVFSVAQKTLFGSALLLSAVLTSPLAIAQSASEPAAASPQQKVQPARSSGKADPAAKPSKTPKAAKKTTASNPSGAKKQKVSVRKDPKTPAQRKAFAKAEQGSNSMGSRLGLRSELDDMALNSTAVLVVDQLTGKVLIDKNSDVALPIASITKVMTAVVTLDAELPLGEIITITKEDTQLEKYSSSRLKVGSTFTRAELLHLALMSSENRAAHALGRTYPGGEEAFIAAMNEKAEELGMASSRFVEPTGLSSNNRSTPRDLARLVNAAYEYPEIRQYSTAKEAIVRVGRSQQQFRNTNALARGGEWDLGLSKTGFIRDAGKCLVMQATIDGRDVVIVMLDAQASSKRLADAERIRRWISADKDRQAAAVRS